MKCSNCGNEIRPGQRFCAHCGAEQPQQEAAQEQEQTSVPAQYSSGYSGSGIGMSANGNKMVLTIFSVICAVVYGISAVGRLFNILGSLFRGYYFGGIYTVFTLLFNALSIVTGVWMCLVLLLIAFRWTRENSDGLLLCLCGGGVAGVVVRLLNAVVYTIFYAYLWGLSGFRAVGISIAGAVVTIGGVYLILRFLLGENPILGKTVQELQDDLKYLFANLGEMINGRGTGYTSAEPSQGQFAQGQGVPPQDQFAQGQGVPPQDQFAQGQGVPPQGQFAQGQGVPPQGQFAQGQAMQNNQSMWNGGQAPNGQYGAYGQTPPGGPALFRLKTDRNLLLFILLNTVTCGIYGLYFIYALARDLNVACAGDGQTTGGLLKYILLSIITCGIYSWIWYYGVGNRLAANAPRYGMNFQENGTTILLWMLFGALLCGIGPFIAMHIIIKNTNMLCGAYNHAHNM